MAERVAAEAASAAASAKAAAAGAAATAAPPSRDPRPELSALLAARRFEESFSTALGLQDVTIVAWLCGQLEPSAVLPGLSPPVLLALVQQLAADLGQTGGELHARLEWIREAALALDPGAPLVAQHIKPVLSQVLIMRWERLLCARGWIAGSNVMDALQFLWSRPLAGVCRCCGKCGPPLAHVECISSIHLVLSPISPV